jgi:hypothetical protein
VLEQKIVTDLEFCCECLDFPLICTHSDIKMDSVSSVTDENNIFFRLRTLVFKVQDDGCLERRYRKVAFYTLKLNGKLADSMTKRAATA